MSNPNPYFVVFSYQITFNGVQGQPALLYLVPYMGQQYFYTFFYLYIYIVLYINIGLTPTFFFRLFVNERMPMLLRVLRFGRDFSMSPASRVHPSVLYIFNH